MFPLKNLARKGLINNVFKHALLLLTLRKIQRIIRVHHKRQILEGNLYAILSTLEIDICGTDKSHYRHDI